MNFLHLITDYGVGDPAFGEVIQKLKRLAPDLQIQPTSVPAFSTLATGFWIGQYAQVNSWPGLTIFSNTAPRDLPGKRSGNEGEPFVYAQLENGVYVCAVNAGYCLSFVKPLITKFHKLKVKENGSQFRSRDFYPEAVVQLIQLNHPPGLNKNPRRLVGKHFFGPALNSSSIPDIPKNRIAFIDGYGNIKTTIRKSSIRHCEEENLNSLSITRRRGNPVGSSNHPPGLKPKNPRGLAGRDNRPHVQNLALAPGQQLQITINNTTRKVTYSNGIFEVNPGQLAFAPGSSGGDDPFMEITLRSNITNGNSAAQTFNFPQVESSITIKP